MSRFDVTMCNPPFYSSHDEVKELQSQKTDDPFAVRTILSRLIRLKLTKSLQVCTGSSNEMITPGGEVQFVGRMVVESLRIGSRIRSVFSFCPPRDSIHPRRVAEKNKAD